MVYIILLKFTFSTFSNLSNCLRTSSWAVALPMANPLLLKGLSGHPCLISLTHILMWKVNLRFLSAQPLSHATVICIPVILHISLASQSGIHNMEAYFEFSYFSCQWMKWTFLKLRRCCYGYVFSLWYLMAYIVLWWHSNKKVVVFIFDQICIRSVGMDQ